QEKKAKMPPAIAKATQVRRPIATVRIKRNRDLRYAEPFQTGFHHHFTGELHPVGHQLQLEIALATNCAHAGVSISDGTVKKEIEHAGQHRVADVTVQPGHRSWLDAALETVAHHQFVSFAESVEEATRLAKIIGIVCVTHDDIASPCRLYASA